MSCLTSAQRAAILALITAKQAQLDAANATLLSLLGQEVEEYRFNSNEGSQWASRRKLEALRATIDWLQSEIDNLTRRLNSTGLISFNLRRKYSGTGRRY